MYVQQVTDQIANVDELLKLAVKKRASDIHIEPFSKAYRIRLRIDGTLLAFEGALSAMDAQRMIICLKNEAGMDIAEKRRPQDGSYTWFLDKTDQLDTAKIDIRVSSMPTVDGEKLVLRLLYADHGRFTLEGLGMDLQTAKVFRSLLEFPYGMILVTGPTGSGKSTTLYTALQLLNDPRIHIVALEDPIEYSIQGITQIEINTRSGVTFATGLRSLLRQDPNVIMIGEIRDKETAEIAIRASLTGHRVLSTLHTTDSIQTIIRLIDMGIEPYLVASALTGVIAQRLVRTCCPMNCKHPSIVETGFEHKSNCDTCLGTGYAGRIGVFEILSITPPLKRLIAKNCSEDELRTFLKGFGFKTVYQELERYVKEGITDFHELVRWYGGSFQNPDIQIPFKTSSTT